jgi:hypothetical protein
VVGEVGGVIDVVCALAPGAAVTLSAWSQPDPTIVLSVGGPEVLSAGDALVERIGVIAGGARCDPTSDEITLEWRWAESVAAQMRAER